MKTMIVGDVHGFWNSLKSLLHQENPDLVLQCGDFGYLPRITEEQDGKLVHPYDPEQHISEGGLPPIFWCDGNHEDHESLRLHIEKHGPEVAPNIFYQPRGSTITLPDGRVVLFFGGADSIDKGTRTRGVSWWPEELPTQADFQRLPEGQVDIVVSHTCPERFIPTLMGRTAYSCYEKGQDPTCQMLDAVFDLYQPKLWFFGHWHWRFSGETDGCRWTCLHMLPNIDVADAHDPPMSAGWTWLSEE